MQRRHSSSWTNQLCTRTRYTKARWGILALCCAMLLTLAANAPSQTAATANLASPAPCQLGPSRTKHRLPLAKSNAAHPQTALGLRSKRNPLPNPVTISPASFLQGALQQASGPLSQFSPLAQAGALDQQNVYLRGCVLLI